MLDDVLYNLAVRRNHMTEFKQSPALFSDRTVNTSLLLVITKLIGEKLVFFFSPHNPKKSPVSVS